MEIINAVTVFRYMSLKYFVHVVLLACVNLEAGKRITCRELNEKEAVCLPGYLFPCLTSFSFCLQVRAPDAVHNTGSADTHVRPKWFFFFNKRGLLSKENCVLQTNSVARSVGVCRWNIDVCIKNVPCKFLTTRSVGRSTEGCCTVTDAYSFHCFLMFKYVSLILKRSSKC